VHQASQLAKAALVKVMMALKTKCHNFLLSDWDIFNKQQK